jgi:histidinol-phosphate aminotransferase
MTSPARLVRDDILALRGYHVTPAAGMVKLDAMENPYRLPEALRGELGRRLAEVAINRYPDPVAERLKGKLRAAMAIPEGLEVMLGNGSDEILQIVSLALARPGATALSLEPSFAMYRMCAAFAGMRYAGVPLRQDFTLDEAALMAAVDAERPALTWISYPNNPTGNLFPREAILRLVGRSPGLVVVDEAYFPFSAGATLLDQVGQHPNLLLVRTVSKLGLAGLRLGLAIGPAGWISELEKLRLPYNVNSLTACAAEFALDHLDVLAGQSQAIMAERAQLESALDRLPGAARFPSATNFVLVRLAGADAVFERLKARGILVRNLHGSHPLLENCLRLTVGTPDENRLLLDALGASLT